MQLAKTPQEHTDLEATIRTLLAKDTAVLSIGSRNHAAWRKPCFESYAKLGFFHIASYDNPYKSERHRAESLDKSFPHADVMQIPHTWVIGHPCVHDGGVAWPWIWQHKRLVPLVEEYEFKYVLIVNDDVFFDKPGGFPQLLAVLGDNDVFPYYATDKLYGTLAILMTVAAYRKVFDIIFKDFVANYARLGNAEARFKIACTELNMKVPKFRSAEDFRLLPPTDHGTWGDIMGIRHLHCETAHRAWNKLFPLEPQYYNEPFTRDYALIKKFWETREASVVEAYWKRFTPHRVPRYSSTVQQKFDIERRDQWNRIAK